MGTKCQLLRTLTGFWLAGVSAAPQMGAQTWGEVSIGMHAAYNFNDLNEAALGGHAIVDLPRGFAFYPAFQWYFVDVGTLSRVSATLRWAPWGAAVAPYVGAGPYWLRSSAAGLSETDMGFIGQLGVEARFRNFQPFTELQLLKDGAVSTEFVAGLRIVVAGRH